MSRLAEAKLINHLVDVCGRSVLFRRGFIHQLDFIMTWPVKDYYKMYQDGIDAINDCVELKEAHAGSAVFS